MGRTRGINTYDNICTYWHIVLTVHQDHGYTVGSTDHQTQKEDILQDSGLQWNPKYYDLDLPAVELGPLINAVQQGRSEAIVDAIKSSDVLFTGVKRKVLEELHHSATELCSLSNPSVLRSMKKISDLENSTSTLIELLGSEVGER